VLPEEGLTVYWRRHGPGDTEGVVVNMVFNKLITAATVIFTALAVGMGTALAANVDGHAAPWQLGLQNPGAVGMERMISFHNMLLVIITAIVLFVLALMIYIIVRFNKTANPTPSKTSHNTFIEIVWTVVPIMILVFIAIPSFKLLYFKDRVPPADITLKATGNQWYWSYEYPDNGFGFDTFIVDDANLKPGQLRLLTTDNHVVVPVNKTVRVIITATDVIHSWAVPALGVKTDGEPGHLNETWFRADKEGTYYGQCSELCGIRHGFMPIMVEVVSQEKYDAWLKEAKEKFASSGASTVKVASAEQLK
jgi:cytochrome c oxidase subunit 2